MAIDPKEWANIWKNNSKLLEKVWANDVRNSNISESIKNLDQAFKYTMNNASLRPSSGLVEMHKIISKKKC